MSGEVESVDILSDDSRYNESFLNFLKELISELSSRKGISMPHEFLLNMVKLAAINPENKFLIKQQMVDTEIDRLKRVVTERIVGMSELSRNIIRMQLHWRANCHPREAVISEARREFADKVHRLVGELKSLVPKHLRHYDLYYSKLAGATIYFAHMGPDTEQSVVTETQEAIAKIFHKEDIGLLSAMTQKDREHELMNIVGIACGLRLFQKEKQPEKYGKFIEDLPRLLPRKIKDAQEQLKSMRNINTERLIAYTTAIKKYFTGDFNIRAGRRELSTEMVQARQGLTMVHQVLIYIRQLTTEITMEEKHVEQVVDKYKELTGELKKEKPRKSSIPNTNSYPRFLELNECWQCLVDSNNFVNTRIQISMEVHQFAESELIEMDDFMERLLRVLKRKLPKEEQFFNYPHLRVELDNSAQIKRVEFRPEIDCLDDIDFNGFCLNSFVFGSGLPLLPNPNLGIFLWSDFKLMFATPEDAKDFSKNPDRCLRRAARIAQRWPELILLMDIEHLVYHPSSLRWTDDSKLYFNFMVSKNSGMQCETHPLPSNIVESYTWNEWELRRRGIILSKIHKCRTHGTQTHTQALRKTAQCQTYAKRSVEVQTNRNVHTSVPHTKFFLAGLRGYNCGMPPHIVEMTSEIPEDLQCVCKPMEKKPLSEMLELTNKKKRREGRNVGSFDIGARKSYL